MSPVSSSENSQGFKAHVVVYGDSTCHVSETEPLIPSFVVPPASSENMVHSRHVIHVEVSGGKVFVLRHHCSG